ncbi:S8 family serine peptidase [Agaribacter flavus]|uniref:S8 family serine peptidase n=1 Tax=Agaribacter flavus TaxID=1902781 RepID=A0ABV7FIZ7_9ALTE
MKFIAVAISVAIASAGLYPVLADDGIATQKISLQETQTRMTVVKSFDNPSKTHNRVKFNFEPNLPAGEYTYIVELVSPAIAQDTKMVYALKQRKVSRHANSSTNQQVNKFILDYEKSLKNKQGKMLSEMRSIKGDLKVLHAYTYALNGFAVEMTQKEALKVSSLAGVKRVSRSKVRRVDTDRGPELIGSPSIWQGQLPSLPQTQGEGIVVGVIDSGVNTDHPSFAEVSGDGYVHTNPLGDGVFLGDCASNFPELCNNKLIGVYSYPVITNNYTDTEVFPENLAQNGEDYGGHGSHVAATAVGNVLNNVNESIPEANAEESDGVQTEFVFDQISGVAPRANLISYQVCFGGTSADGDTYADCPGAAIAAGIDSAIADGVDVINFSISGGGNPWNDPDELAFLSAMNAGIFVATSAGNSGPNPQTSEKNAPWYTSVAAAEHGRENAFVKELTDFSGGNTPPPPLSGQSNTGSITASIVYAGDFSNPNDPGNDPAQCLQPFPANTFAGQIVVCDRGQIAGVDKAINVEAGGAGGYVLANVDGGDTFLANDQYVVPGIHMNAENGNRLKAWLASGSNHRATITTGMPNQTLDPERIDNLANFSSRGPNATNSTLTPTLTAPGVNIFSAYADQQFGHDGQPPAAGDFSYLSGTSMSSPHAAGSAALLSALHPTWTPDNIRSALSMTANTQLKRNNATETADYFDMGAGRIQVDQAAQVGLVLDESFANYVAANPARGGDPRQLNLPSITDSECRGICEWTRTFTATQDGSWEVSAESFDNDTVITVEPTNFNIVAGQSQDVRVTINSLAATKTEYIFGALRLSASNSPNLSLPISVLSTLGDIPTTSKATASRAVDETRIENIKAISIPEFFVTSFSLSKATVVTDEVSEDSDNEDYLDNIQDGVVTFPITVPDNAKRLITKIVSSSAVDLDLFLLFDADGDGELVSSEEIARSTSPNEIEEIAVNFPDAGDYVIAVQSFTASNAGTDAFELRYVIVTDDQNDTLQVQAPASIEEDVPFNIDVAYKLDEIQNGDEYFGAIGLSNNAAIADKLGLIELNLDVGDLDTRLIATPSRLQQGDSAPLTIQIAGNNTDKSRSYRVSLAIPNGTSISDTNNAEGLTISDDNLIWLVTKATGDTQVSTLDLSLQVNANMPPGPIALNLSSALLNRDFESVLTLPSFDQLQVEGAPQITFTGIANNQLQVTETQTLTIPIVVSDPNNDAVTVSFIQTSGTDTEVIQDENGTRLIAPSVENDETLVYTVVATDAFEQETSQTLSILVNNNQAPVIESITSPDSGNGGEQITLSFTASDPEQDSLSFSINGIAGSSRTLTLPRNSTSLTVEFAVSDGVSTTTESRSISIVQAPTPPPSSNGGGGSLSLWLFGLLAIISSLREINVRYAKR